MDIGNNLRRLRVAKNAKAPELGVLLGVSVTTYNRIENNQASLDANLVPKIAEYFGTTISGVYGVDDKNTVTNPTQHIKDSATGIMVQHNNPTKEQPSLPTNEQNPLERIIAAIEKTVAAQATTITAQQAQIARLLAEVDRLKASS